MADRRTDESPLAPRRPLGAPGQGETPGSGPASRQPGDSGSQRSSRPDGPRPEDVRSDRPRPGNSRSDGPRSDGPPRDDARSPGTASSERQQVETRTSGQGTGSGSAAARPRSRKARLRLTHLDPWSVMKTAFLLSVAFGIVTVVAVAVVWSVLGAAGVWDSINRTVQDVIGGDTGASFDVEDYVGTSRVMGFTMIVAVVDVVLITAIATLAAFLYNLAATLLGGLEVTLAEDQR